MIPAHRIQLPAAAPRQYGAMLRFSHSVELDHELRDLIDIRASMLNGCAFCLEMHWKDARERGASEERLYALAAWRESSLYDARERAALALTDAVTQVAETQVPDDVWEEAARHFDEDELAQLLVAITAINAWNRLNIAARTQTGHYTPGMFG